MWWINASAAYVISFTILGILFYIGILVAETLSHECPFQTLASVALRVLLDSKRTRKMLATLAPLNIILFPCIGWMNTRKGFIWGVYFVPSTAVNSPF